MSGDLSFVQLILEASAVVQLVMALLLAASVMSWAIILRKRRILRKASRESAEPVDGVIPEGLPFFG